MQSTAYNPVCILLSLLSVVIISACGGSTTAPDESMSALSDQLEIDNAEISAEPYDAETSEQLLVEKFLDHAFEALISMNRSYSRGELGALHSSCVESTGAYPLIEFDCSEAAMPATLEEFGLPVSRLRLIDDPFCREQLVSAESSLGCVIETLDVQFSDSWHYQSRYHILGDMVTLDIQLFQNSSPPSLNLDNPNNTCLLTMNPSEPTQRNDEALCQQATQALLMQIDQQ